MRTRAARLSLALALAAVLAAAGAAGPALGVRALLQDLSRTAAAPAHAAAAAGLPGPHGVISVHKRWPAADAVLVPAALLASVFFAWAVLYGGRAPRSVRPAPAHARAPPVRWQ